MLTIGDLSRHTGVKVPTIRYYEQMGLVSAVERSKGNQRRYGTDERDRLTFIKHARELGISIDAIKELLELSAHPDIPCARADKIASEQLVSVRGRIAKLRKLETELERIATRCGDSTIGDCYVIRSLANHEMCEHEQH